MKRERGVGMRVCCWRREEMVKCRVSDVFVFVCVTDLLGRGVASGILTDVVAAM